MITLNSDESTCFKFIGCGDSKPTTHLISNNTNLISSNFGGGEDTCSFYSGPSDASIMAFCESNETAASIAYSGAGESCGSIAYSGGGESCGSIASSCGSVGGGSFSGGGCSYSC